MQRFPHLYELRHPKTNDDLVHVAEQFRDLPHDARLEHRRESRAVADRAQLASAGAATATTRCSSPADAGDLRAAAVARRRRAPMRRHRRPRRRSVTNATASVGGRDRDQRPARLVDLGRLQTRAAARLHRELVDRRCAWRSPASVAITTISSCATAHPPTTRSSPFSLMPRMPPGAAADRPHVVLREPDALAVRR